MTNQLSEAEERLLAEVLAGDRMSEDPAIAAACSGNPIFAAHLAELQALVTSIDSVAAREQDLIGAEVERDPALEQLVASTLKRLAAGTTRDPAMTSPPMRKGPRPWLLTLLAAACLAILWAVFREPPGRLANEDEQQLSGQPLVLDPPMADATGITFRWRCTEPSAEFEVLIYDPAIGEHDPIVESDDLRTTEWHIEPSQADRLAPNAMWRVTARVNGRTFSAERALR